MKVKLTPLEHRWVSWFATYDLDMKYRSGSFKQ